MLKHAMEAKGQIILFLIIISFNVQDLKTPNNELILDNKRKERN